MKKIIVKGGLNLNKKVLTELSDSDLNTINGGGPRRSKRRNGNCRYSRNHHTQCGEQYSRSGACCEVG